MSRYWFLAADCQLEEIDLSGFVKVKVRDIKKISPLPRSPVPFDELDENMEVLYAANEEETGGLTVSICRNPPYGVHRFIKRKNIYWLQGNLDNKWHKQIYDYIANNLKKNNQLEIWSIWVGGRTQDIIKKRIKSSDIYDMNFRLLDSTDICISVYRV